MQVTVARAGGAAPEDADSRTVIPVTREVTAPQKALPARGTVVSCRGGRRLGELLAAIAETAAWSARSTPNVGRAGRAVLLSEVDDAPCLSTVVVLPPRGGRGEQW
ncbi:hypothetical protein [Saccharopolyspora phatthalungensis]|uniref:Uncharacterized protein n=1 Tax=Saccharopolyspora phatthalungensis TaxID=664693 RepID=A0A840QAK2_9PSEU|nr:hypothetical protein [Saccharopolyspora phatthalungensis]MBB5155589.1 hypothetical protein [Saccharopolyspora phatthalungensis]